MKITTELNKYKEIYKIISKWGWVLMFNTGLFKQITGLLRESVYFPGYNNYCLRGPSTRIRTWNLKKGVVKDWAHSSPLLYFPSRWYSAKYFIKNRVRINLQIYVFNVLDYGVFCIIYKVTVSSNDTTFTYVYG